MPILSVQSVSLSLFGITRLLFLSELWKMALALGRLALCVCVCVSWPMFVFVVDNGYPLIRLSICAQTPGDRKKRTHNMPSKRWYDLVCVHNIFGFFPVIVQCFILYSAVVVLSVDSFVWCVHHSHSCWQVGPVSWALSSLSFSSPPFTFAFFLDLSLFRRVYFAPLPAPASMNGTCAQLH